MADERSGMWKARRNPQKMYRPGKQSLRMELRRVVCPADFYGTTLLGRAESEVWLMPIGHLLDQWKAYKQFNGLAKPKREYYIDEIIPSDI